MTGTRGPGSNPERGLHGPFPAGNGPARSWRPWAPGRAGSGAGEGRSAEVVSRHVVRVPLASTTLPPADHTNAYVVRGEEGAVVWDAPGRDERALAPLWEALRALGEPPVRAVVLSHAHPDHVERAAEVCRRTGAPARAHPSLPSRLGRARDGIPWGEPLGEGDRIDLGGVSLVILFTPGHAPDHLVGWVPEDRALLAGDLLAGEGTVAIAPPEGDLGLYLASLGRVEALAPKVAGPGHGPTLRDPVRAARETYEHRMMREREILALLREGVGDPDEMVRRIYGDTLSARVLPFARATVAAHLAKLAGEGRAREEGGLWRTT
ncbi:MAG: MBL fold metallo-hydrolase [Clostridia bacterium]|nr:MBL fold metallo-hydrolase [Clostridia bacterium]